MQFGHLIRKFQLFSINHAHILLSSLQLNTDNWVTATIINNPDEDSLSEIALSDASIILKLDINILSILHYLGSPLG